MRYDYDYAIIGAGASGLIAADFALKLGARVALIEKELIGGDCTWSGCVPSKSLIKAASVAHALRRAAHFGVSAEPGPTNMAQVRAWLDSTIEHIYAPTTPESMRAKGLHVELGAASFVNAKTLLVGDKRLTAGKVLINTGAQPRIPAIAGLDEVPYLTYKQIFTQGHLPRRLIVVGGGPIGCEIAQSYRRLGAKVSLVAERLLSQEDAEASSVLASVLAAEGVTWIQGRATRAAYTDEVFTITTTADEVQGEMLLIATGRAPVVQELGLDCAGVRFTAEGIGVDAHLRTSARTIYAAGDVLGGPQYSHLAGWQGFQATRNALLPGNASGVPRAMPRITFTSPEVAQVGLTEQQARHRYGDQLQVGKLDLARVDRAVNEDDVHGFLKLIATPSGKVLGGTYVGERASEAITEVVIAIDRGITLQEMAGVVHPYPSYAIGFQFLATEMAMRSTFQSSKGRMLRLVSKLYR